jgi:hypothetical protein
MKDFIEKAKEDIRALVNLLFSRAGILVALAAFGFVLQLSGVTEGWWLVWVGIFTGFDVELYAPTAQAASESAYRLGQGLLFVVLTTLVYHEAGPNITAAALTFWWFLGCDYLYIWARRESLRPFSYFDMSPVVFHYKYVLHQPAAPIAACTASVIAGVVGALYFLFY